MTSHIDFSSFFVIILLAGTFLTFVLNHFLEAIDYAARKKNGGSIPDVLSDIQTAKDCFDVNKLKNICAYENSKYFSWIPSSICSTVLALVLVIFGFYPWLFKAISSFVSFEISSGFGTTFLCAFLFFVIAGIPEAILSIPFELYNQFVIEKKFGFNKMTFSLWIKDSIKTFIIGIIMNAVLVAAIVGVLKIFPSSWWLFLSCFIFAFTLIMQIIYPNFIAPVFNKFTPLEDGELKDRITALIQKTGFKSEGVFVMDASKRSGHSNAYFIGLGKAKRIVLYDTLIKQLTTDELESVLGHELGHFKLKHIVKKLFISVPVIFILMFVLYKCAQMPYLYTSFGFDDVPVQFIGLFLAAIVWSSLTEVLSPVVNAGSRRDEYAADKFSAEVTGKPEALVSGLIKLNSENLSELFPPPFYVFWNYTHPTLSERTRALKKLFKDHF